MDLVQKTSSRSRRTEAVQEYWKAAVALLDLRYAEEEFATLQRSPVPDSALKRGAIAAARARVAEARMELRRQREELAARYGAPVDAALPLPADRPFIGPYDTKILGIYSSRRPPRDARELDQLIAETGEIAAARGEAAAHAGEARNAAGGTIEQYLAAFDRCRDARIAFLAAVRDYNLAIANYALYVSDPSLPAASVAKMLVDVPAAPTDPVVSRTATSPAAPASIARVVGETRPPLPPGAVLISSVPIDPSEMGKPIDPVASAPAAIGPVGMATPPELPAVNAIVQPATAILPAEEIASGERNDVAAANSAFDPPRELTPSESDEPMLQDAEGPAEPSDFQPTPPGLQPAGVGLQPQQEGLQPKPDGLQPSDDGLVPGQALQEEKPAAPVTGLEFSGAAVR